MQDRGDTACMLSTTMIGVEEYLRTTYRPDCDYIDGELRERNLGEQPHAYMQTILAAVFHEHRRAWGTRALTEQRVQTSATHYRISDLCVLRSVDPFDGIVRVAPLLCVEVLSRGDSLSEMQERVDDYQGMGVEHVWVVDPWRRVGYVASVKGFLRPAEDVFTIAGTKIRVSLAEVFAEFDEGLPRG